MRKKHWKKNAGEKKLSANRYQFIMGFSELGGPVGSADTQIAYPQQFKDGYPAGTNTALRVCYRSLLHRFPQMQKINDSAYVVYGFNKKKKKYFANLVRQHCIGK